MSSTDMNANSVRIAVRFPMGAGGIYIIPEGDILCIMCHDCFGGDGFDDDLSDDLDMFMDDLSDGYGVFDEERLPEDLGIFDDIVEEEEKRGRRVPVFISRYCFECGALIREDEIYVCPECGASLCPACRYEHRC